MLIGSLLKGVILTISMKYYEQTKYKTTNIFSHKDSFFKTRKMIVTAYELRKTQFCLQIFVWNYYLIITLCPFLEI